jgi:hypothetical protein
MIREAACCCGALRVTCMGTPSSVAACHCGACQRRTGSVVGLAAFFPEAAVTIAGAARCFTRGSDAGPSITFHFCPECGSTVYWRPERKPGIVAVAVGAFADPSFPGPAKAVFEAQRPAWLTMSV